MAEAALRSCGGAMAEGTPRKRSRDPEGSYSPFQTPEPKRLRGFPGVPSPSRKPRDKLFASQIRWSPSSDEESKENEAFPGNAAHPRRLEISPIPTAAAGKRESPGKSSSHKSHPSHVPVGAFYGKGRSYLDPLERKRLRELQASGEGSGAGNFLGKTSGNSRKPHTNPSGNSRNPGRNRGRNSRNPGRNPSGNSRNPGSKAKANPGRIQGTPKVVKEKGETREGKENGNSGRIPEKKAEWPRRVLSMGVRPALRLPLGSAFFSAGKRSHSRKIPGEPRALPRAGQGTAQAGAAAPEKTEKLGKSGSAQGSGTAKETEASGRIPEPREEEKENREGSVGCGNPGEEGKPSGKSRNGAGDSEAGAAGSSTEESPGTSSSPSPESKDSLSIPSPAEGKKDQGSPCRAGLYPIFIATPGSRRRPPDALPCPFGISPSGKALGSHRSLRAKESPQHSRDQMIIDAGQRRFGAVQCPSCGMLYAPAIPEDQLQHLRHHRRLREGLRYLGWKKERVVAEFWDGKIVLILPGDPKYAVRKAEEVRQIVDAELGFQQAALGSPPSTRSYLFVSPQRSVLGCLVAEGISQAFRVLSEPGPAPFPDSQDDSQDNSRDSQRFPRAWRCSLDPEPAVCGISRIWVLGACRRRGIARRMVDVLRRTFVFGAVLSCRDLAFSDPTADGRAFASDYCREPDFLVYNFLHRAAASGSGSGSVGSGS